ncbi:MAG: response regulator, partial [Bryobacteraceae bacterium]
PGSGAGRWVNGLAADRSGRLIVATERGVYLGTKTPGGKRVFEDYSKRLGIPESRTFGVYVDPDGIVWIGSGLVLYRVEGDRAREYNEADGLAKRSWDAILTDREGSLWIRTKDSLMVKRKGEERFEPLKGFPQASAFGFLAQDRRGKLLLTTNRGLMIRTGDTWETIDSSRGLPDDTVTYTLEDREGSLWIGTRGAGLARWLGYRKWEGWTKEEGLSHNHIWDIRADSRGSVWAGTNHGLSELPAGARKWRHWPEMVDVIGANAKAVAIAPDGSVWAGFAPGGLARLDPRSRHVERFGKTAGLTSAWINSLAFDREGQLWVAMNGGVFRGRQQGGAWRFAREDLPGGDPTEIFPQLVPDTKGRVWVAGSKGLAWIENGQWRRITQSDGMKATPVRGVVPAANGDVWVQYIEAIGVSRLKREGDRWKAEHFGPDQGLRSGRGWFIGEDSRGWIWHGSDIGADVFDGSSWRHYGRGDGLIWDDCNSNSFWAASDGSVWIGTSKGLSHFNPDNDDLSGGAPPPLVLTDLMFGDNPRDPSGPSVVPYADRSMLVRFAALSFNDPSAVRFRYRLRGLDDHWSLTTQREVPFANLPHGKYTFEVQTQRGQGSWSEAATSSFEIRTPWWATWWFRLLAVAAAGFAMWQMWRWRVAHLLRRQRLLEAAVRDRTGELRREKETVERQKQDIERLLEEARASSRFKGEFLATMSHEIRTPMNGVIGMTGLLLDTELSPTQRQFTETINTSSEALLGIIDEILDFSKIESGKMIVENADFALHKVIEEPFDLLEQKAEAKGVELVSVVGRGVPFAARGDAGKLRRVLINLLGNAVKFTHRGQISLEVSLDERNDAGMTLQFSVRDTGIGMSAEAQSRVFDAFTQGDHSTSRNYGGTGLGLAISKRLVEMTGGSIHLESETGKGSHFWFTVRLDNAVALGNEAAQADGGFEGRRVLIVGEQSPSRDALRRQLAAWDVPVEVAAGGIEALGILLEAAKNKEPFKVCLISTDLSDMNGIDLAGGIRSRRALSGLRTVLLSSLTRRTALDGAPVDGILVRPVRQSLLRRVLIGAASASARVETAQAPAQRAARKILIADDNQVNRTVAVKLLAKLGYESDAVTSGQEALDALEKYPYAAVLMDCHMPGMDGFEATAEIRRQQGEAHIPIIAMTASAMKEDRERCLAAGMDDYVSKPIHAGVLEATLKNWVSDHSKSIGG